MKFRILSSAGALAMCFAAANAVATEYDYEGSVAYGHSNSDTVSAVVIGGVPMPFVGGSISSSDSDRISMVGEWYFNGLTDDKGPKSRAAFLSRASSVSLDYSHDEESGSTSFFGTIISIGDSSFSASTDAITAGLRYVWQDSGWYGLAGISRAEAEFDAQTNGTLFSFDDGATAYILGIGKYIGAATAIDLVIADVDSSGSGTAVALSFTHVGSFGDVWQYATDVAVSRTTQGADEGRYDVSFSLYPSAEFEFGVGVDHQKRNGGFDQSTYEGFASWFVRDNVKLSGRYSMEDFDEPVGTNLDGDAIGIGIIVRF